MKKPNYTQVANIFMDEWMSKCSGAETKIFIAISRKTIGWQKDSDKISYSQLKQMTGLSINAMKQAITGLIEKELITQWKVGQAYYYDLVISENDTEEQKTVSKNDIVDIETVSKNDTTIERDKENNIKKANDRLKPFIPLARLLYEEHKKLDENFLANKDIDETLERWANDIRLLHEIDKRGFEEIRAVIKWTQAPGRFWNSNIMSGLKLRKQFPVLILQMKNNGKGAKKKSDWYEKNKAGIDRKFYGGERAG